MKLETLSYGLGIAAAIMAVTEAKAPFFNKAHQSRTIVPNSYVVEFAPHGNAPVFFDHLNNNGIQKTSVRQEFQSTFLSGISFTVHDDHNIDTILNAPGVAGVWPVWNIPGPKVFKDYKSRGYDIGIAPQYETAHNITGVAAVHDTLQIFGEGVKVGVIDTGLYYPHPAFGVDGKPGCFKQPGCRVQYGYDLVGDNYSAANPFAVPDPDPIDNCSAESHGTHVAGIIGANASHITTTDFVPAFPFYGVAPRATLGAYRVFGCTADNTQNDVITQAILLAAKDGMDVINLSLGGGSAWHEELQDIVATRVGQAGHIVLGAQGNDGGTGPWVGGNPGLSQGGFGVASIDNIAALAYALKDPNGKAYAYSIGSQYGKPFPDIKAAIIVNNPSATPQSTNDDGCNPLTYDASGKVVMFLQGSVCGSKVRCANAFNAKAVGCLVYNNAPGGETIFGDARIPGGALSEADGQAIVALVKANPNAIFDFTSQQSLFASITGGTPSSFTSWAMDPELYIKPNIAGVGGNVYSTLSPHASANVGYGTYSGTSMATPYTAGSLALFISSNGKPGFNTLKACFQNGAHPTYSFGTEWYAPVPQQGAGLVNVLDTILSKTLVTPSELALNDTTNTKKSYKIVIKNKYATAVDYLITHEPAATSYNKDPASDMLLDNPIEAADYATVKFSQSKVTIPAGASREITLSFTPPASSDPARIPVFSGYVVVAPQLENAPLSRVTYAGLKGSWKSAPIFSNVDKLGGATNGLYNSSFSPITQNTSVNVTNTPLHAILVLSTPSRLVYADVVPANGASLPLTKRGTLKPTKSGKPGQRGKPSNHPSSLGYLMSDNVGPFYLTLAGRNSETAGQSSTQFTDFQWSGLVTNSTTGATNTTLPAGSYRVRFFGLKHFGNPQKASDWQVDISPVINLVH